TSALSHSQRRAGRRGDGLSAARDRTGAARRRGDRGDRGRGLAARSAVRGERREWGRGGAPAVSPTGGRGTAAGHRAPDPEDAGGARPVLHVADEPLWGPGERLDARPRGDECAWRRRAGTMGAIA